jgi:hypothetical protein
MLEKYCDILVVGNDLPGLIIAAFLARRGLSVQVIDYELYSDHPEALDPVCFTNTHSKLLRSILGRLNVPETTIQNYTNKDSTLQIIFPHSRIDVYNNPLTYFEEIEREFADHVDIKRFYEHQARIRHQIDVTELFQQLLPSSWKEKRVFNKFIQEQNINDKSQEYQSLMSKDSTLAAYFKAQVLLAYQSFVPKPFAYQIAELFNPGDGEIFGIHGGIKTIKNMLYDRIRHYDGIIRKKTQIKALLFRNGAFDGVQIDDQQNAILSKYLIWNGSLEKLGKVLPNKWRFRKLKKFTEGFEFDHHWFTAKFTVDRKYIPEPMKGNVISIIDPKKELIGDNLLYLQIKRDKVDQEAIISVNFLLPHTALNEGDEFFESYFKTIKESLLKLLPFSHKSLKQSFPLASKEQKHDTLFPLNENDFEVFKYSAAKYGVSTQQQSNFMDLFQLHYKTPAPNFYISNSEIFQAFGMESKLMLGLKITDLIWKEVDKVKKRAMKSEKRIA